MDPGQESVGGDVSEDQEEDYYATSEENSCTESDATDNSSVRETIDEITRSILEREAKAKGYPFQQEAEELARSNGKVPYVYKKCEIVIGPHLRECMRLRTLAEDERLAGLADQRHAAEDERLTGLADQRYADDLQDGRFVSLDRNQETVGGERQFPDQETVGGERQFPDQETVGGEDPLPPLTMMNSEPPTRVQMYHSLELAKQEKTASSDVKRLPEDELQYVDIPRRDVRGPNYCPNIVMTEGCLFESVEALGHAISADIRMGAGIAYDFKCEFGGVQELFMQRILPGGVAILKREVDVDGTTNTRFIYNLVTKTNYYGKPTLETLGACLRAMKDHAVKNGVKKICLPRIGAGLDKLWWNDVYAILAQTFGGTDILIRIFMLPRTEILAIREEEEEWMQDRGSINPIWTCGVWREDGEKYVLRLLQC
jgi:O-acetyl-ADP-ribose deacetylase (regulator of RNase III)